MPQKDEQVQYVRLPNGDWAKFRADATTQQMRDAIMKKFPEAYAGSYQQRKGGAFGNVSKDLSTLESGGSLMKREGETDQQFLARAVEAGRNVSPEAVERERQGDLVKAPIVLSVAGLAPLIGSALNAPGATLASLGAGMAGSELGHRVGGYFGHPRIGATMGGLAGGVAGPAAMSRLTTSGWLANLLGREVAEGPMVPMSQAPYDYKARLADLAKRIEENKAFGEGKPGPNIPLSESPNYADIAASRAAAGKEAAAKLPSGQYTPLSESPYATQQRAAQRFSEGKAGPSNLLSRSPNVPEAAAGEEGGGVSGGPQGQPGQAGTGQDLITRTRALVKPGEPPSPADLKRAGDLTQAPLHRLRTLSKFGDKLSENEINRRLRNESLAVAGPLTASIPQLTQDGKVHYAPTTAEKINPMRGFPPSGANIESPSGKKISYFASAGSPKPPASGVLGEMAYDDKKGHLLAWNGSKWVEADDAARQEIRTKIADERAHLVGEFYKGGQLTKDQVMIFAKQKLIGTKEARSIINGPQEERP